MKMSVRMIATQTGLSYGTIKTYLDRSEFTKYSINDYYYDNAEFICKRILELVSSRKKRKSA